MEKATFKFNLISGVEAEVTFLTGKQQRILTQQLKGQTYTDRLDALLADVLVRVGSFKAVDVDFVRNMLSEDRRLALVMARQFTMDFEKAFKFVFEYESVNGGKAEKEFEIPLNAEGTFPVTPMSEQYKEYHEIPTHKFVVLPKSGLEVRFELATGNSERIIAASKKEERSTHTVLEMRRPTYKKDDIWRKLDLDGLHLRDIEALRAAMKEGEGKVDTEIQFEHPEAEFKEGREKIVTVDVISSVNFFYPSGKI
jgi:hypothetical protein